MFILVGLICNRVLLKRYQGKGVAAQKTQRVYYATVPKLGPLPFGIVLRWAVSRKRQV